MVKFAKADLNGEKLAKVQELGGREAKVYLLPDGTITLLLKEGDGEFDLKFTEGNQKIDSKTRLREESEGLRVITLEEIYEHWNSDDK